MRDALNKCLEMFDLLRKRAAEQMHLSSEAMWRMIKDTEDQARAALDSQQEVAREPTTNTIQWCACGWVRNNEYHPYSWKPDGDGWVRVYSHAQKVEAQDTQPAVTGWEKDVDGEDYTPARLYLWLMAQYRRHSEEEDRAAANLMKRAYLFTSTAESDSVKVDRVIINTIIPILYDLIVDLAEGVALPKELRIRVMRALPQSHIDRLSLSQEQAATDAQAYKFLLDACPVAIHKQLYPGDNIDGLYRTQIAPMLDRKIKQEMTQAKRVLRINPERKPS